MDDWKVVKLIDIEIAAVDDSDIALFMAAACIADVEVKLPADVTLYPMRIACTFSLLYPSPAALMLLLAIAQGMPLVAVPCRSLVVLE
jgi:hypothetical protein